MFQLQEYDYAKLLSYWKNYQSLIGSIKNSKEQNPLRAQRAKDIIEAIEYLFNDANEDMQQIIIYQWWRGKDISEVASSVHMPVSKVRRMQRVLLKDTADRLHWV